MNLFGKWKKEAADKIPDGVAFDAGTQSAPAPQNPGEPLLGQNRKILVVDDNQVVLKAFELKLKALGFTVLTACDGSEAVSLARNEQPDLIVLDINFPPDVGSSGLQWDGFNIMQWMRRFHEVSKIPVIIITGGDPQKFKDRALAAGAAAFFHKPINNEEFLITIRRILGQAPAKPQTT